VYYIFISEMRNTEIYEFLRSFKVCPMFEWIKPFFRIRFKN
jgi:hypothetical protein